MAFWREHGGTVLTIAVVVMVVFRPVDRLLPVPMPVLEPGPRTTWLPEVEVEDGRLRLAKMIDPADVRQQAKESAASRALFAALGAQQDGRSLAEFLDSQTVGSKGDGKASLQAQLMAPNLKEMVPRAPEARPAWLARCLPVSRRLGELPWDERLVVPTLEDDSGLGALSRVAPVQLTILHLAAAERLQALATPAEAPAAAVRLLRLADLCADLGDLGALGAAHHIRREALDLALARLAGAPRDEAVRSALAGLPPARVEPLAAALRTSRLLSLGFICGIDRGMRAGSLNGRIADLRLDSPPDVNVGLRATNEWWDATFAALGPEPTLATLTGFADRVADLPSPLTGEERQARPLANRLLFPPSAPQRRVASARLLAMVATMVNWTSLIGVARGAVAAADRRAVLDVLLAHPPADGTAATAYVAQLRAQLPERFAVTAQDGEALVTLSGADAKEAPLVRIPLGTP